MDRTQQNLPVVKLMSYNCRSIRNKVHEVMSMIDDHSVHLAAIQETWLRESDLKILNDIEEYGYTIESYRKPRKTELGGGVALIYKKGLKLMKVKGLSYRSFEFQAFDLKLFNGTVRILNVYRAPYSQKNKVTVKMFLKEFEDFLLHQSSTNIPLLVLGDFNIHFEVLQDLSRQNEPLFSDAMSFQSLLHQFSLKQRVTVPTHKQGGTIDFVINEDDSTTFSEDIDVCKYDTASDHYPIFLDICKSTSISTVQKRTINTRKWSSCDMEEMKSEIKKALPKLPNNLDANAAANTLISTLSTVADKLCPKEIVSFKPRPRQVWFTEELRKLKRYKRKLERKWKKSGLMKDLKSYEKVKASYFKQIKAAQCRYLTKSFR